jgi:thymidylate kinase
MKTAHRDRVRIVSFSGIDGAGKTTQIQAFSAWLRDAGFRVEILTFWDDVVAFSHFRERVSHKVFRGDEGIGSPEKPLNRRDKNVSFWPVTAVRFFLYFLDALNLYRKIRQARRSDADVVIFDRYIYDEFANLPPRQSITEAFVKLIVRLVPAPDVSYIVDADPEAARARKPEYPLEFIHKNREAYLALRRRVINITLIEPLSIDAAQSKIRESFLRAVSAPDRAFAGLVAVE